MYQAFVQRAAGRARDFYACMFRASALAQGALTSVRRKPQFLRCKARCNNANGKLTKNPRSPTIETRFWLSAKLKFFLKNYEEKINLIRFKITFFIHLGQISYRFRPVTGAAITARESDFRVGRTFPLAAAGARRFPGRRAPFGIGDSPAVPHDAIAATIPAGGE